MKGLLYRDLQINKKSLILSFVFLIYLFYLIVKEDMMAENDKLFMINLYTFINIILVYAMAEYILKPDKKSKWEVFLYATPVTKQKIVGEKYLFDYIFMGIGIFTSVVFIKVFNMYVNRNMSYNEYLGILYAILLILLNSAIHKPLTYTLGEKGAGIFSMIFVMAVFIIGTLSILAEKMEWIADFGENMDSIIIFFQSKKMLVVLGAAILLHCCSYFLSAEMYNTNCD